MSTEQHTPASAGGVPRHVAVIMDGNGRWARQRHWNRVRGHREGIESVRALVRAARDSGVRFLTVYAFSTENWGRPEREVRALMGLLRRFLQVEVPELRAKGVRVRTIGDIDRLPPAARETLAWAVAETAACSDLDLCLALSYGGREEILHAVKRCLADGLSADAVDEDALRSRLYAPDIPDPDLLIRTSGELRVSNFLLWQIAYTEIYVTDTLWPEFREDQFRQALSAYRARQRRFGLTDEQCGAGGPG
jgi:undecaprenyl diphosphate synthase